MSGITDLIDRAKSSITNARTIITNPLLGTVSQLGGNQGNGIPPQLPPERLDANGNPVGYGDVQQKSSHNSYLRDETILEQFTNQNITSFELDIHNGDPGLNIFGENYAENGDFYVYHDSLPSFGNMGSETHYPHLSNGLADIVTINAQNPNHDVITLHIDIKDVLDSGNGLGPEDLDRLLREQLGDMLYTPDSLMSGTGSDTLAGAFNANGGMPSLNDLEGQVMIVLTGSDEALASYNGLEDPVAFISANPNFEDGNFVPDPNAVFYNIPMDEIDHAEQILDDDYILRAYGANDAESYQAALDAGVHHIGTDYISPGDDNFATSASNEIFHQGEQAQDAFGEAKDWAGDQIDAAQGAYEEGKDWAGDQIDAAQDAYEEGKDWVGDQASNAAEGIGDVLDAATDFIPDVDLNPFD